MSDLELLLEKVRTAEVGSPELDDAIHAALFPDHEFAQLKDAPEGTGCMMYRRPDGVQSSALRITTSIDAIVALIARELPGWAKGFDAGPETCIAFIDRHDYSRRMFAARFHVTAATAPLALCAAFLAAKIHYQFRSKP